MDILNPLNNAIDYIEDHLCEEIDNDELSKIVCCSTYHFTRMFSFISGITLMEYIRKRRLTLAALELQNSDIKVIDVAYKYNYSSPTAFTNAFKSVHGVSPSMAKRSNTSLKSYPKLSFQISIKGDVSMNYRIVKVEEFKVIGLKKVMNTIDGNEDFDGISKMWMDLSDNDAVRILEHSNNKIEGLIGLSANNDLNKYDYYIATTTDVENSDSLNVLNIAKSEWAIFEVVGALPDSMIDVWKRIFTEWFPSSGYENTNEPCLEIYSEGDSTKSNYTCELWIPILKVK